MKKFKVGDKALLNKNTRIKFFKISEKENSYFTKNINRNAEVEIVKVEKADKKVGGCSYYIKANIDGKEYLSSHSIPNNTFLPHELRLELEQLRKELGGMDLICES